MRGNLFSDDIEAIFQEIDDDLGRAAGRGLSTGGHKVEIVLAGSAPLIFLGLMPFGTFDIDCVSCSSAWLSSHMGSYCMNARIKAFGDSWAYNYEDRLETLFDGDNVTVYSLGLEDLVFMKLARWSFDDVEDVGAMLDAGADIDLELLDHLVHDEEESRGAGMSDRAYGELLCAYGDFLERIESEDWSR